MHLSAVIHRLGKLRRGSLPAAADPVQLQRVALLQKCQSLLQVSRVLPDPTHVLELKAIIVQLNGKVSALRRLHTQWDFKHQHDCSRLLEQRRKCLLTYQSVVNTYLESTARVCIDTKTKESGRRGLKVISTLSITYIFITSVYTEMSTYLHHGLWNDSVLS